MADRYGFSRSRRGVVRLTLEPSDVAVLDQLLEQLIVLLEPDGADAHDQLDPLAALVGIGTATQTPDDPALARLLPDAYGDDAEASSEFRRYTELSLREQKQANAELARETLSGAGRDDLGPDALDAWLRSLNDLRLALGTRLEVTEDLEAEWAELELLDDDDPRRVMHHVYDWLGFLQGTLLRSLDG
ncbi:MAG TPA: DUF2017 domain-containing protein [Candidatus Limnocylindria bacterium]|nr:DUF2017 domain-containing protein [Candidatus Limnocylindria bacterium]